jgi:hypothetical protein
MLALLRGATEEVTLSMTFRQAIRFRQRVHQLRESMRKSSHPKYELCTKVRIGLEFAGDTPTQKSGRHRVPIDRGVQVRLILSPNDSEFGPILAAAGIRGLDLVEAQTKPLPSAEATTLDTLDQMFGELKDPPHG